MIQHDLCPYEERHQGYMSGFPSWLSGKESSCQCRRCGFHPLVLEDPLEKEIKTHSIIFAWRIPWTEEPGGQQPLGLQRGGHDSMTLGSLSTDKYLDPEISWGK